MPYYGSLYCSGCRAYGSVQDEAGSRCVRCMRPIPRAIVDQKRRPSSATVARGRPPSVDPARSRKRSRRPGGELRQR